jgi:hypothetical protein
MTSADHANWLAIFALLIWPLVALALYAKQRIGPAALWTILGAQMVLPVGAAIKFQGIPALDKITIPNIAILILSLLLGRQATRNRGPVGLAEILMALYVLCPFITAALNQDPVNIGGRVLPPADYYDALSAAATQFISIIPFIVGRAFLRTARSTQDIMIVLVVTGLIYSIPLLFEIRMSPQLHGWLYGYVPTDFIQTVREGGGFRPMAFMGHGLTAAFFLMTTVVAATALWKTGFRYAGWSASGAAAYLGVVLILCKSAAAIVYAAIAAPLIRFASPKIQVRVALALVSLSLLYPVLRTADLIPVDTIVSSASFFSEQRADSMKFRFDNESGLLTRASERILFGWGRFGRSRLYDPDTGKDMSVTDGRWIITIGQFGLVGFLLEFGLLALGVFRCRSALRLPSPSTDQFLLGALALIVAIGVVNLLPNGALLASTWLLSGALLGRADEMKRSRPLRDKAIIGTAAPGLNN